MQLLSSIRRNAHAFLYQPLKHYELHYVMFQPWPNSTDDYEPEVSQ